MQALPLNQVIKWASHPAFSDPETYIASEFKAIDGSPEAYCGRLRDVKKSGYALLKETKGHKDFEPKFICPAEKVPEDHKGHHTILSRSMQIALGNNDLAAVELTYQYAIRLAGMKLVSFPLFVDFGNQIDQHIQNLLNPQ